MSKAPAHPSFTEALSFWLKLGFISFGGPAGQVSIMHEYLVEKKKWISESRFLHAFNYCMLLPGPEAQQLATYTGWLLHGVRGGLAAGLLFIFPSAVMLWILSYLYVSYGDMPLIAAMFSFLKPAVVAIIIVALIKIGKKSLISPIHYIVATIAFALIYFFNIPFPLVILGAMGIGIILSRLIPVRGGHGVHHKPILDHEESSYLINLNTVKSGVGISWKSLILNLIIFSLLWLIPLVILFGWGIQDFGFWKDLSVFFTKSAFVTFGGAYAVLPYVAHVSVESFGWLSQHEMIDGLALGETTPGPLIIVLAFVGFMAGYNVFEGNMWMATLGLTLTTYYTFLPSFLFIFIGAPIIERTQTNPIIKSVLGYVTAAVAGVILTLGLYFGKVVIFPSASEMVWVPFGWIVISFISMHYLKVSMLAWIGISLGMGIITYPLL
ncbi:MAG: chromate efflux transporter [Saprospiraceae bacterium]|nr:chromate efflux transporter [Saprospiraceae bacterium]